MSPAQATSTFRFKVVFLGDAGVGKTSLILRLTDEKFDHTSDIDPTCDFDRRSTTLTWKGQPHTLQLWDTAGEEMFRTMTSSYFRNADAIILMFDLSRPETFENMCSQWYKDCLNYTTRACMIVVGSKSDLTQRVPQEDIDDFVDSIGVKYLQSAHNSPPEQMDVLLEEFVSCLRANTPDEADSLSPRRSKLRSSGGNGPIMRRFRSLVKMVIPSSPSRPQTSTP